MRFHAVSCVRKLSAVLFAAAFFGSVLFAQAKDPNKDNLKPDSTATTRLRIEVTTGEKSSPLDMASVYIRYDIKHLMGKDEHIEMNIKTNREGVAIAADIPRGKVLVQVVADGWKSFGKWYDTTENEQTIKVHLERPPKWF
ncbi:MAG: hypothetical protein WAM91_11340 [Candidatus Acidiferrales bacterium]